eukprot:1861007-Rhodomonas_salina.1
MACCIFHVCVRVDACDARDEEQRGRDGEHDAAQHARVEHVGVLHRVALQEEGRRREHGGHRREHDHARHGEQVVLRELGHCVVDEVPRAVVRALVLAGDDRHSHGGGGGRRCREERHIDHSTQILRALLAQIAVPRRVDVAVDVVQRRRPCTRAAPRPEELHEANEQQQQHAEQD